MSLNVRHLEIFRAVVKAGSVSGAARLLYVSQPAVTKTLRLLELELKLPLFYRVRGRLAPTPEAETLLPAVERLFGSIESVDQLADQIKTGMNGRIKIATVTNLAMSLVANVIAEIHREYPEIVFDVHALPTRHVIEYVNTRQVDLGILDVPYPSMGLQIEEFCVGEVVCVMRRDNPLAERLRITPDLLHDQMLITFADDTRTGWALREAFRAYGLAYKVGITSTSSPAACSIVARSDRAVGLLDPFILMSNAFPQLIRRPFGPRIEMRPRMLFPSGRPVSIATTKFIEHLRRAAPDGAFADAAPATR